MGSLLLYYSPLGNIFKVKLEKNPDFEIVLLSFTEFTNALLVQIFLKKMHLRHTLVINNTNIKLTTSTYTYKCYYHTTRVLGFTLTLYKTA